MALKAVRALIWVAAVWITLSCLGYGLAWRQFGKVQQPMNMSWLQEREGRATGVRYASFVGVYFKIDGNDPELLFPMDFVDDWGKASQYIQPGAHLWVKFYSHENDFTALEVRANPRTPFPIQLGSWNSSISAYNQRSGTANKRGNYWLILAAAFLPLALVADRISLRVAARLPKRK